MVNYREYQMNKKNQEGVIIMREELLKGLTEEQIKKVKECKSSEEILDLAKAEGVQLSEEQLEAVSGGGCSHSVKCTGCGSKNVKEISKTVKGMPMGKMYKCRDCEREFAR